jgi:hypothetical protein
MRLTPAQWRERARWIRGSFDLLTWDALKLAAEAWEVHYRGRAA